MHQSSAALGDGTLTVSEKTVWGRRRYGEEDGMGKNTVVPDTVNVPSVFFPILSSQIPSMSQCLTQQLTGSGTALGDRTLTVSSCCAALL